ncbi:MAG: hypothetical protein WCA63_09185 [Gallionella sp.]
MVYLCDAGVKPRPVHQSWHDSVRQIGNSYNTIANGMEQMMTLSILIFGASPDELENR